MDKTAQGRQRSGRLQFGPGALVAAAFIGPGTVTTCTLAGSEFGFGLLWALVFATIAALVFQDMACRLGVVGRMGLGEALLARFGGRFAKIAVIIGVATAIVIGNSAYQAGNLTGGALGLAAIIEPWYVDGRLLVGGLAVIAGAVLATARYAVLERVLVVLVGVMSAAFILVAVISRPDIPALFAGLKPQIPAGGLLAAIALIGTTIVPYNIFLHAAAAKRKWSSGEDVQASRIDSLVAVSIGGLVSMAILVTAATGLQALDTGIANASDMARALEPTFGRFARYLVGFGLAAAGLTSAITAPMAAGFVCTELAQIKSEGRRRAMFRWTALIVLAFGAITSLLGLRPVQLIVIAQAANGLLLPLVAAFLLMAMNQRAVLGDKVNGLAMNLAGWSLVIVVGGLGVRSVARALGFWP